MNGNRLSLADYNGPVPVGSRAMCHGLMYSVAADEANTAFGRNWLPPISPQRRTDPFKVVVNVTMGSQAV